MNRSAQAKGPAYWTISGHGRGSRTSHLPRLLYRAHTSAPAQTPTHGI